MDSRILLIRYWFEFKSDKACDLPPILCRGCGITAFDHRDAISILRHNVFKGEEVQEFKNKIEHVDIRTLDQAHVVANMGDPTVRGVWYPMGY